MRRQAWVNRQIFVSFALPCAAAAFWGCAAGAGTDTTSQGDSATSSTSVTSSVSTGGSPGTGGFNPVGSGGSGGAGGSQVCTSTSAAAHRVPIDILFLIDRSGSMSGIKWEATTMALTTFFNDPMSVGIGAGMIYLPTDTPYDCDVTHYETPTVPIAPLPGSAFALTNSLPADATGIGTPLYGALKGTLLAATAYQDSHPTHKVNVVFATDGEPVGCDGFSNQTIANLASSALDYDGVHTYVIGAQGSDIATLDLIAAAGGTTSAFDITQDASLFFSKMQEIRTQALGCDFAIPPPPHGAVLNLNEVNFSYTPGGTGTPEVLPRAHDLADCGNDPGWYFDSNDAATKIIVCPASCTTVENDDNAKVDVLFGCASILK